MSEIKSIQMLKDSIDLIKYRGLLTFNLTAIAMSVLSIFIPLIIYFMYCYPESLVRFLSFRPHFYFSILTVIPLIYFSIKMSIDKAIYKYNLVFCSFICFLMPIILSYPIPNLLIWSMFGPMCMSFILILFSGIFLNARYTIGFAMSMLLLCTFNYFHFNTHVGVFTDKLSNDIVFLMMYVFYGIALTFITTTMVLINNILKNIYNVIPTAIVDMENTERFILISQQRDELYREIQKVAIPRSIKTTNTLAHTDVYGCTKTKKVFRIESILKPCDGIAGGDFFDIVKMENNLIFWVGDVEGHDIGSAIIMSMIQSMLNGIIKDQYLNNPDSILDLKTIYSNLNKIFHSECLRKFDRNYSVSLILFKYSNGVLEYVGQHEPFFVKYLNGSVNMINNHMNSIPFGIEYDITDVLKVQSIHMAIVSGIFIYTDGVVENRDVDCKEIGWERLIDIYTEHHGIVDIYDHYIKLFSGTDIEDDLTMISITTYDKKPFN